MMMSCPIQPTPANFFCTPATAAAAAAAMGGVGGCGADLLDMGGAGGGGIFPPPLLAAANPHPLFPSAATAAAVAAAGGKLHHHHQHQQQQQTATTNGVVTALDFCGGVGACQPQRQQHQQHNHHQLQQQQQQQQQAMASTPGSWFFQQSPILDGTSPVDASSVASVTVLNGFHDNSSSGTLSSIGGGVPPPMASQGTLSPSPGSLAHHQLLARFGPRHTTESVEVPSSEHVAEIVGRQGCKIKALRAKTNTYIKTPVRGEEPVFVVTGQHEDVLEAKREIECAAEHFTQIRASRRHSQGGCPAPGHVTAYVRVPLRVVGLVVGPKGNTIKRIQQDTHTYIITPSREREPIFEVTGLPQNVEAARREIEQHIYQRTGNMPITDSNASIANYDLHVCQGAWSWSQNSNGTAALQAQHAALHANATNRPNYGALAVASTATTTAPARQLQQQQQHQAVLMPSLPGGGGQHQQQHLHHHQSVNQCQQHQQQQPFQYHHHQQHSNGNQHLGLSLGDLNGSFRNQQVQQQQQHQNDFGSSHEMVVTNGIGAGAVGTTKLYSSVAASPPPSFGPIGGGGGSGSNGTTANGTAIAAGAAGSTTTTAAASAATNGASGVAALTTTKSASAGGTAATALGGAAPSPLGTSMSSSNLFAMLGALELDSNNNGGTDTATSSSPSSQQGQLQQQQQQGVFSTAAVAGDFKLGSSFSSLLLDDDLMIFGLNSYNFLRSEF